MAVKAPVTTVTELYDYLLSRLPKDVQQAICDDTDMNEWFWIFVNTEWARARLHAQLQESFVETWMKEIQSHNEAKKKRRARKV